MGRMKVPWRIPAKRTMARPSAMVIGFSGGRGVVWRTGDLWCMGSKKKQVPPPVPKANGVRNDIFCGSCALCSMQCVQDFGEALIHFRAMGIGGEGFTLFCGERCGGYAEGDGA